MAEIPPLDGLHGHRSLDPVSVRTEIAGRIINQIDRLRRRLAARQGDLRRANQAIDDAAIAKSLVGWPDKDQRGRDTIVVAGCRGTEDGDETLSLDPQRTLQQNIDRIFRRARRYRKAQKKIAELVASDQNRLEGLVAQLNLVQAGTDETVVAGLLEQWTPKEGTKQADSKSRSEKLPVTVRQFLSKGGIRILVGRSATENQLLTFSIANGLDLWLHAYRLTGSHVVIRMSRRKDLDHELLLDAANLALYFSKARRTGEGEVVYTRIKHVRRPKRGRPGEVMISNEKIFRVRIDAKRIDRLLGRADRAHDA